MKKEKRLQYIHYACIILFILIVIVVTTGKDAMFGSKMDWIGQHTTFPDYFRMLFYQTKDIFPDYAFNIGGGTNIYFLSYYGFLNPLLMFSFLLPFVKMVDYIMVLNILTVLATGILLYKYLVYKKFSMNISFMTTMIAIASTFLIFHAHRHYMFINYMPFLILGLFGVDRALETKKKGLFIFSVFMMIMTSYYYSITGIVVLALYTISEIIQKNDSYDFRKILKEGYPLLLSTLLAVMMSGILLLPTAHVILAGRGQGGLKPSLLSLLLPKANLKGLVYDPYTLGITATSVIAIFTSVFSKKKNDKFLSIFFLIILCVPICVYILNGGLYIREKILLPFFPILAIFLANMFSEIEDKTCNIQWIAIATVLFSALALLSGYNNTFFYLDLMVSLITLYVTVHKKNLKILFTVTFIIAMTSCLITQSQENFPSKKFYHNEVQAGAKEELMNEALKKENNFVRVNQRNEKLYTVNKVYSPRSNRTSLYSSTSNKIYADFLRKDLKIAYGSRNGMIMTEVEDAFLEYYLGVKYIVTTGDEGPGYEKIKTIHDKAENRNYHLYENKNVLPVLYARKQTMSKDAYEKLTYPKNVLALLQYVITDDSSDSPTLPEVKTLDDLKISHIEKAKVTKTEDGLSIDAKKGGYFRIDLPSDVSDDLLIFQMDVAKQASCKNGDLKIRMEQVENKLTCKEWQYQNNNHTFHFVISNHKNKDYLNVWFDKGTYEIKNIHTYRLSKSVLNESTDDVIPFELNKKKSVGDKLEGNMKVPEDQYFVTTIPYDEGFTVYVDGKKQAYEKVNKAFLGFPIKKGNHSISIEYKAPFKNAGFLLSGFGFVIFIIIVIIDKKKVK